MSDPQPAARQFGLDGSPGRITPLGVGLINDTFVAEGESDGGRVILQRLNRQIFRDIPALMENVDRVTRHLRSRGVTTLEIVRTVGGELFYQDPGSGDDWRAFKFIGGTSSFSEAASPSQAEEAAHAFGEFARELVDLGPPPLHETIPDFHNIPKRLADLLEAIEADGRGRAASVRDEIDQCLARADWATVIRDARAAGDLPVRVVHNDAKIENVLFDAAGERAVCVVDLDTVMPGSVLHDFGDLVRSTVATAGEEERELDRVSVCGATFEALLRGYRCAWGQLLTPAEVDLLPDAGKLITYEQALRFLSDYLQGDVYYRISYPDQNLQRARNQLHLARLLDQL